MTNFLAEQRLLSFEGIVPSQPENKNAIAKAQQDKQNLHPEQEIKEDYTKRTGESAKIAAEMKSNAAETGLSSFSMEQLRLSPSLTSFLNTASADVQVQARGLLSQLARNTSVSAGSVNVVTANNRVTRLSGSSFTVPMREGEDFIQGLERFVQLQTKIDQQRTPQPEPEPRIPQLTGSAREFISRLTPEDQALVERELAVLTPAQLRGLTIRITDASIPSSRLDRTSRTLQRITLSVPTNGIAARGTGRVADARPPSEVEQENTGFVARSLRVASVALSTVGMTESPSPLINATTVSADQRSAVVAALRDAVQDLSGEQRASDFIDRLARSTSATDRSSMALQRIVREYIRAHAIRGVNVRSAAMTDRTPPNLPELLQMSETMLQQSPQLTKELEGRNMQERTEILLRYAIEDAAGASLIRQVYRLGFSNGPDIRAARQRYTETSEEFRKNSASN